MIVDAPCYEDEMNMNIITKMLEKDEDWKDDQTTNL